MRTCLWLPGLLSLLTACSPRHSEQVPVVSTDPPPAVAVVSSARPQEAPPALPALMGATLTTARRLRPARARSEPDRAQNPASIAVRDPLEEAGVGALIEGPGEARVARRLGGTPRPAGPKATRLARFVHLSDAHIVDDESPARAGIYDAPGATAGALRPQEAELCRLLDAAVRTINGLHRQDPIDFALLGGDNIDNAQGNELSWFLSILGGSPRVKCDSGREDDLRPGPANDGKDAFVAEGLKMPWKWVTGNHDVLLQGNAVIDVGRLGVGGSYAPVGTRDYARGGEVFTGLFVTPDAQRTLLGRRDLLGRVRGDGDGHGLSDAEVEAERASYSFDAGGARFVVLDTAAETGGAAGLLRQEDAGRFLAPSLAGAAREHRPVVLVAHHPFDALVQDGGRFGQVHADALLPHTFAGMVGESRAVAFSLTGHSHRHRVRPVHPGRGPAFWEVTTGSLADFPHQFRLLELWDEDNGWLRLSSTCVDVSVEGNPAAQLGRSRGVIDYVSGYTTDGPGAIDDRNVDLWIPRPGATAR
jgi:3',5'-cyclic AMP phosphodiesterase CpdA